MSARDDDENGDARIMCWAAAGGDTRFYHQKLSLKIKGRINKKRKKSSVAYTTNNNNI
jgi:hypothetical protein